MFMELSAKKIDFAMSQTIGRLLMYNAERMARGWNLEGRHTPKTFISSGIAINNMEIPITVGFVSMAFLKDPLTDPFFS